MSLEKEMISRWCGKDVAAVGVVEGVKEGPIACRILKMSLKESKIAFAPAHVVHELSRAFDEADMYIWLRAMDDGP